MDKYEISLWEDYPDLTSSGIPFLNERKICVIGSNTMTSAARALEPKLVSNVNGTNTFSFRIYYRYKDEITGEENINPYLSYIINERKVKVLWKNKWYDLVIKKIEEDTQKRSVLCTCEDLFISELSKNGYELEFNSELQNNSGTAGELMEKVLDGSGWQPAAEQQSIIQYQEEPVYEVRTQGSVTVTKQSPSGDTSATIPADKLCLLYQSCIDEDCVNIQFLYSENGYATEDNNMLVLNGDCYTFTGKVAYSGDQASIVNSSNDIVFQFTLSDSFSSRFRAKRLVNTQLTAFDELLGRYVDVYENDIYGYETTEYSDPTLVVNLIANPKDFKDTKGWIGNDLRWEVYPEFTGQNNQTVVNYNAKSYLKVSNGDTYNTALVSNKQYLTPNSTDIKNGILGGFQIGEKYIFRYKAKSSKDSQNYISSGISGNIYEINNDYTKKGQPYFQVESSNTNNGWIENELICIKTCTANDLDLVGFFINANSTYFIEDIQFFKLAYGIDSYDSSIVKRINPGEISLQSIATVVYRYYNADHDDVTDAKDLKFLYQGTTKSNSYIPKYNNYEKITSIEESKSNRFNILQSIAEKFQCWVRFIINHDENGRVLYDNQGLPQKYVQLVEQIGNDTGISFEYGIDLKGIKRTIVSNTIASKAIIIPNENEFGKHGFCTIARSPLNYCRENFILNFDYYIQQGLLNKDVIEADLYKTNGNNLGYFFYLNKFNKQYDSIANAINIKQIELTKQKAEYKVQFGNYQAALEKLGINKADLMSLANVNTFSDAQNYASTHPTNRKVQSLMGSIAQLNNNIQEFEQNIPKLKNSIDVLEAYINEQIDIMNQLVQNVENLHKAFFKKYSRFIQEGTWQDQNYVNDDDYYLDALEVAYRSSRPQIQYDISLLRLSGLEDFSSKIFDLGDICYIQDKEFFGYEEDGITPYKQKIIISQLTSYFDTPEKDVIKVQNYKTQFDDLFQRITTATQALQFSQGRYERAAGVVKPDGTLSFGLLQDTFDYNKDLIINSANQEVTWDNTGITVSDSTNSALKVKIMAGGIFASDDGGDTWKNALRGDGISTDLLTAGRINTSEVFVYDGNHQSFRWDSQGINAYTSNSVTDANGQVIEYPFSKFVRFDRFGIYGYQGTEDFIPSIEEDIWDENSKVKFGLTWKGFFLRGSSGGSSLNISDDGSGITFLMKNTIGNNSLEISTTNDIVLKNGNINRVQIGRLDPSSSNTQYGIWIRDGNGNNIFNVSSSGTNSIGGWTLTKDSFYHTSGNNTIGLYSSGKSATVQEHADNYYILAGNNFGVTIDGNIYANAGKIAGFTIGSTAIYNNNKSSINSANSGVYIGTDGIKLGNDFKVTKEGAVTASNLEITGGSISINYSQGNGFYVSSNGDLYANSGTFAGNVYAKNIQSGGNYGYFDGSGIAERSIYGSRISNSTIGTTQLVSGVNTSLGYADSYNAATVQNTSSYPTYFTAGYIYGKNQISAGSFYSSSFLVSIASGSSESEIELANHYHTITELDGRITIGAPYNASSPPSFKIADTETYKAAVSAQKVTGITHYNDGWTFNDEAGKVVYDATNKTVRAPFSLMPQHDSTNLLDNPITNQQFTIPAGQAYDAGLTSATANNNLFVNKKSGADPAYYSITYGGSEHWLIPVTVYGFITGTKSDGTTYTSSKQTGVDTITLDFTDIYNEVYTNGSNSVDTIINKGYETSEQGATDYTKLWVRLENNKTIGNIDISGAYNAGVASVTPASSVTISSVSSTTNSGEWDYSVSITNANATYSNSNLYGYINIKLSNDKTYTTQVAINGTKAYNAGVASVVIPTISSVAQTSYSNTTYDYSVSVDTGYLRYSSKKLTGRIQINFSDNTNKKVFVTFAGDRAYDAGVASVTQRTISSLDWVSGTTYSKVKANFSDGNSQEIALPKVASKTLYQYAYDRGVASVSHEATLQYWATGTVENQTVSTGSGDYYTVQWVQYRGYAECGDSQSNTVTFWMRTII